MTQPIEEPVTKTNPEPTNTPAVNKAPTPTTTEVLASIDNATLLKAENVQTLLQNARQQEKDKLYKTIETKDDTIKQQKDKISDLEKELQTKGEEEMESNQELLAVVTELKESQEKLLQDLETEKENTRLAKLDAYKTEKIQEANGLILEDLVNGNTEEEINQSIEVAKARYNEIVSPYKTQLEQAQELAGKPNPANAPSPQDPQTPSNIEFTSEEIRAMSPAEYAKYREKLLGMAKK